jgi:hypothetical protein
MKEKAIQWVFFRSVLVGLRRDDCPGTVEVPDGAAGHVVHVGSGGVA